MHLLIEHSLVLVCSVPPNRLPSRLPRTGTDTVRERQQRQGPPLSHAALGGGCPARPQVKAPCSTTEGTKLRDMIASAATGHHHRVWIVDAEQQPVGAQAQRYFVASVNIYTRAILSKPGTSGYYISYNRVLRAVLQTPLRWGIF